MNLPLRCAAVAFVGSLPAQELRRIEAPMRFHACFDAVRGRVLAVGHGGYTNEWNGVAWRRAPDRGAQPGFVHVDGSGRVVQLRELDPLGPAAFAIVVRDGLQWQPRAVAGGPSPRAGVQLVHDPVHDVVIAFGGRDMLGGGQFLDDTWTFDGTVWLAHPVAVRPPGRMHAAFAYDQQRQRAVLFGGYDLNVRGDLWEWDGAAWTPRSFAVQPPARSGAAAAYDRTRQRVALVGGSGAAPLSDHWEYDGATWQQLPPLPAAIAARTGAVLVHDGARSELLLLGAEDAQGPDGRVDAFDGTSWVQRPGFSRSPIRAELPAVASSPAGVLRLGGIDSWSFTATSELWRWDGAAWSLLTTGPFAGRGEAAMWQQQGATFVFGGRTAGAVPFGDTWRWNGAWLQVPGPGPSPRHAPGVAHDATNDRALLFGGARFTSPQVVFGDTWLFDGAGWQQVAAPPFPPPRYAPAIAFDPVRNRVVMAGGTTFTPPGVPHGLDDTWEYNGSSWQQIASASPVPWYGVAAFDAALGKVVYTSTSGGALGLLAFDGTDWTPVAATLPPSLGLQLRAATSPAGRLTLLDELGVGELLPAPAGAAVYGAGCTATPPVLSANGLPIPGDAAFALEVTRLPANGIAVVGASDAAANVPALGCTLLVAPLALLATAASPAGYASLALPLPPQPLLLGQSFFFQPATIAPAAPAGVALGAGLRLELGQ